jgi:hypothetical protein
MKVPISVNNRGDVSTFASVEEAEACMEPIDVERGEYVVTDADGRRLEVDVVLREAPLFWGLWRTHIKKVRIVDPASGNHAWVKIS